MDAIGPPISILEVRLLTICVSKIGAFFCQSNDPPSISELLSNTFLTASKIQR